MLLGVMADSHDHVAKVESAVRLFNARKVERVVHAGDFVSPFALAPFEDLCCPLIGVFGNNDGERVGLAKRFEALGEVHPNLAPTNLGGRSIAAVHYPELALPIARGDAYDLVIYGHTHEIDLHAEKALVLNPGETGGWLTGRSTVAVVELETLEVEIVEI